MSYIPAENRMSITVGELRLPLPDSKDRGPAYVLGLWR